MLKIVKTMDVIADTYAIEFVKGNNRKDKVVFNCITDWNTVELSTDFLYSLLNNAVELKEELNEWKMRNKTTS